MSLPSGVRLGAYEILALIGAGGMGEVYKARDTRLDRTVALKILPAALALDPQFRDRFHREAKAISALDHPHICALYDVGEQDGTSFLVMQYLEGETLADRLTKGALPLDQALRYAIEIASALDKAHRQGITHRDLKPGNIVLTKAGAKLLDFGLAKAGSAHGGLAKAGHYVQDANAPQTGARGARFQADLSATPTMTSPLTALGTILGTFQYMAPEQVQGEEADARTDLFAFGAVVYEMVTGRKAFEGKTQASVIAAILEREPPPISTSQPLTPRALDRIVKKCLAKDPERRWQSAGDLADELRWVAETASTETAAPRRTGRSLNGLTTGAAIALALVLLGVTPMVISHWREPASQPRPVRFAVSLPDRTAFFSLSNQPFSVSPDGRSIAFVAEKSAGTAQLWLHRLDELDSQPLTGTEGAAPGSRPIWSPDSGSLAFVASGRRTLKRIDVAGGPATNVALLPPTLGTSPSGTWNVDGEFLLAGATGGILRVSAVTGQVVPVSLGSPASGSELSPVFLTDGRRFLYSRQGSSEPGIYLGSLDSGETRRLLPYGGRVQITEGFILYSNGGAVVAQRFDAQNGSVTGDPVVVVDNVSSLRDQAAFSVSANGVLAYISGSRRNTQFASFSRAGQQLGTIGEAGAYSTLSISPDERSIVTGRFDQNGGQNLWAIELARQVTTRLTFGSDRDSDPRWSPDGKRLIYASVQGVAKSLFEIPSSGGPPHLVLKSPEGFALSMDAWSPDGRTILYHIDTLRQLWALQMDGDRKPSLVYEPAVGTVDEPSFSPDGKWIAFNSDESGTAQVTVVPFPPTGAKWQVSAGAGVQPHWRGDGRELYFLAGDGKMMAVDVRLGDTFEAGMPHALFQTDIVPSGSLDQYVVTGDGQRFLLMAPVGAAQSDAIQVILDWPGLLK